MRINSILGASESLYQEDRSINTVWLPTIKSDEPTDSFSINCPYLFVPFTLSRLRSPARIFCISPRVNSVLSQQPPVQLVVCYKPSKGLCYCSPQRTVPQAFLLVRYKAVLLESSFLDSSACSFIYFCTASSVILPIVST